MNLLQISMALASNANPIFRFTENASDEIAFYELILSMVTLLVTLVGFVNATKAMKQEAEEVLLEKRMETLSFLELFEYLYQDKLDILQEKRCTTIKKLNKNKDEVENNLKNKSIQDKEQRKVLKKTLRDIKQQIKACNNDTSMVSDVDKLIREEIIKESDGQEFILVDGWNEWVNRLINNNYIGLKLSSINTQTLLELQLLGQRVSTLWSINSKHNKDVFLISEFIRSYAKTLTDIYTYNQHNRPKIINNQRKNNSITPSDPSCKIAILGPDEEKIICDIIETIQNSVLIYANENDEEYGMSNACYRLKLSLNVVDSINTHPRLNWFKRKILKILRSFVRNIKTAIMHISLFFETVADKNKQKRTERKNKKNAAK